MDDLKKQTIGFIGGGNMARAIGASLIKKGVVDPKLMWISARTESTLEYWKKLGTNTTLDNGEVIKHCDTIFVAVKPQMLGQVFACIPWITVEKLFVSVLVGVTIKTLVQVISSAVPNSRVIRAMPNTPLTVDAGITVYCCGPILKKGDLDLIQQLFSQIGLAELVEESQMNALGALCGSGPAFAYQIIEALSDGAVMAGVPRAMATKFAAQVLIGAGKMVIETEKHPGELKDEVCSPGGTTITGVHAMEQGGVRASLMNAIQAAVARSEQLAINSQK